MASLPTLHRDVHYKAREKNQSYHFLVLVHLSIHLPSSGLIYPPTGG